MTPALSKVVFVVLVIGWCLIRYEYARGSRREKIVSTSRGPRETALLLTSLAGLGILPLISCCPTGRPVSRDWSVLAPCILAASPGKSE
jgi:hypothetical protein